MSAAYGLSATVSHSLHAWSWPWLANWLRKDWFKTIGPQIQRTIVMAVIGMTLLPVVKWYLKSEYHHPFWVIRSGLRRCWHWVVK